MLWSTNKPLLAHMSVVVTQGQYCLQVLTRWQDQI